MNSTSCMRLAEENTRLTKQSIEHERARVFGYHWAREDSPTCMQHMLSTRVLPETHEGAQYTPIIHTLHTRGVCRYVFWVLAYNVSACTHTLQCTYQCFMPPHPYIWELVGNRSCQTTRISKMGAPDPILAGNVGANFFVIQHILNLGGILGGILRHSDVQNCKLFHACPLLRSTEKSCCTKHNGQELHRCTKYIETLH